MNHPVYYIHVHTVYTFERFTWTCHYSKRYPLEPIYYYMYINNFRTVCTVSMIVHDDVSYKFINRALLAFHDTRHVRKLCQQPSPRDWKHHYSCSSPDLRVILFKKYNIIVICFLDLVISPKDVYHGCK